MVNGTHNPFDIAAIDPASNNLSDLLSTYVIPSINPAINVQTLNYPAAVFPMHASVATGVTDLTNVLLQNNNGSNPETNSPFMVLAVSQGAIVWSTVLEKYLAGTLGVPNAQCLGSCTFGNPVRNMGSYVGTSPGGAGILAPTLGPSPLSPLIVDYADAGDLFTSCSNPAVTLIANALYNVWGGSRLTAFQVLQEWGALLQGNTFFTLLAAYDELYAFAASGAAPHNAYWSTPNEFGGGNESAATLAYANINNWYAAWLLNWTSTYG
jgi:hypothetical protein